MYFTVFSYSVGISKAVKILHHIAPVDILFFQ